MSARSLTDPEGLFQALKTFSQPCHLLTFLNVSSFPSQIMQFLPSFLPWSREEEFAGWGSTSLPHKECCCISLGIRFITAGKQESRANHIGGILRPSPTLSLTHTHTHTRAHKHKHTVDRQKEQSKQKEKKLIQETLGYTKDGHTVIAHYCKLQDDTLLCQGGKIAVKEAVGP